jgi:hypothetical protein
MILALSKEASALSGMISRLAATNPQFVVKRVQEKLLRSVRNKPEKPRFSSTFEVKPHYCHKIHLGRTAFQQVSQQLTVVAFEVSF